MAKRRNEPSTTSTTNSKTPIAMMVVAAIAVIALVAWALTRSVDRTSSVAESIPTQQTGAVDTSTFSTPPAGSSTGWSPTTSQPTTPQVEMTPPPISSVPQSGTSGVQRIAVEDLKPKFDRGEVTIIDTRDPTSFAQGHIPGAILIPMASIQTEIPNLPKNKPIVAYCT